MDIADRARLQVGARDNDRESRFGPQGRRIMKRPAVLPLSTITLLQRPRQQKPLKELVRTWTPAPWDTVTRWEQGPVVGSRPYTMNASEPSF
jgi:hypothetical protein